MGVTEQIRNGFTLLRIRGILDGHTPESLAASRYMQMEPAEIKEHFVLELSGVEYINSSMLGGCIQFLSTAQVAGYKVLILNPSENVASVLDLTGLSQLLSVVYDEAEIEEELLKTPHAVLTGEDVDYDELAEEIESAIQGKPKGKRIGESVLDKLLGDDRK